MYVCRYCVYACIVQQQPFCMYDTLSISSKTMDSSMVCMYVCRYCVYACIVQQQPFCLCDTLSISSKTMDSFMVCMYVYMHVFSANNPCINDYGFIYGKDVSSYIHTYIHTYTVNAPPVCIFHTYIHTCIHTSLQCKNLLRQLLDPKYGKVNAPSVSVQRGHADVLIYVQVIHVYVCIYEITYMYG